MKASALPYVLVIALSFGCATAKDYCRAMPKAKMETDTWFIPEAAFTKEAADKALKNLASQVDGGVGGKDFNVDNDLKMIKGYMYRAYLAEDEKAFGSEDAELKKEFCTFLKMARRSRATVAAYRSMRTLWRRSNRRGDRTRAGASPSPENAFIKAPPPGAWRSSAPVSRTSASTT
jgi:hypothetical protein